MKKIILILLLVSFAVTSYAIDFSAQVFGAFNVFDSDNTFNMGGGARGRIRLEAEHEQNGFGAWARLGVESLSGWLGAAGYMFYKPNDALSFYIDYASDGHWGLYGNAGWNFYGFPGDVIGNTLDRSSGGIYTNWWGGVPNYSAAFDNAFFGGFSTGAYVSITPFDALAINIGLPVFYIRLMENMLKSVVAQITFSLGDSMLIGVTYEGNTMTNALNDSPILRAYFGMTAGAVKLDIGAGFMFPEEYNDPNPLLPTETSINYPLNIGAAAEIEIGSVNLKARLLIAGFGSRKYTIVGTTTTTNSPVDVIIDILPSMHFTENIQGYLNFSLHINTPDGGDSTVNWSLFPYIVMGNMDTVAFYTGLELISRPNNFRFRIPVGLSINF